MRNHNNMILGTPTEQHQQSQVEKSPQPFVTQRRRLIRFRKTSRTGRRCSRFSSQRSGLFFPIRLLSRLSLLRAQSSSRRRIRINNRRSFGLEPEAKRHHRQVETLIFNKTDFFKKTNFQKKTNSHNNPKMVPGVV
jgi:hypothetical protein